MFRSALLTVLCLGLVAANVSKRKTTRHVRQVECAANEFKCQNGRCIQEEWTCDSDNDCGDNSDEHLPECPPRGQCTGPHEVACKNGECVPIEFRCDGDDDCRDGTDEAECPSITCSGGEFHCANGLCVEPAWLCDGDDDCKDGSDELPQNCHH